MRCRRTDQSRGGTLLAEFAGTGNARRRAQPSRLRRQPGVGCIEEGDAYFGIARKSTALHVAAWRAQPEVVKELIARGAPVHAKDGKGARRSSSPSRPASIPTGRGGVRPTRSVPCSRRAPRPPDIVVPCGYDDVDTLLRG
jgi:hypothetical protein